MNGLEREYDKGSMKHETKRQAFTLVEVIVAVLIFAVGALGVFGLAGAIVRMNALSERVSSATSAAESQIERLMGQGCQNVVAGTNMVDGFLCTWTVTTNASLKSKTVGMSAQWQDLDGARRKVTLQSVLVD